MARIVFVLFVTTCAILVLSSATQYPRSKFKAAVYEHKVILPEHSYTPVSRQKALSLMYQNLAEYKTQAETAARQNVDILVFPEDGIYGMILKIRRLIAPYLEYIPDPKQESWNPCTEPGRHANTEVQQYLSCLARNNTLYLVANMGDKQPCSHKTDPGCPYDGQYQFNTDVVYEPTGTLIAKYHKQNLFYETQFNKPKNVNYVHFETPFGRFGVFTCFDILFREPPITLIERYGIGNVVFPTAWIDALPLLTSIQFHSSFAVKMGVNLLAANLHAPYTFHQGSGIYTPDTNAVFYYNTSVSSGGKLLISEIDVVSQAPRRVTISREDKTSHRLSSGTGFPSVLFHDVFNFVLLKGTRGSLSVCNNKLCCYLDFEKDGSGINNDVYAFGALDKLHTYSGHYYLQICTLIRCANSNKQSCGTPVTFSKTRFRHLRINGTFGTPYVFPAVLLTDGGQLKLAPKQWKFNDLALESTRRFDFPLLAADLIGRVYDRDRYVNPFWVGR